MPVLVTGNLGVRILPQMSVQDSIGDLFTHLVRVTLAHRLRGEQESSIKFLGKETAASITICHSDSYWLISAKVQL